jgi:cytochrome P450
MTTEETLLRFPFPATPPSAPAEEFGWLRDHRPVAPVILPTGDRAWLVTGYAGVRQVLADPRLSRAATTRPDAPRMGPARPEADSMMAMDAPDHTRLRKLVTHAFTMRRIEALRPGIERHVATLLDGLRAAGPPGDLVEHLAQPLPITVICEILGVPLSDQADFSEWTDTALSVGLGAAAEVQFAREMLYGYLAELVELKCGRPGDDLLSVLVLAREDGDRLTERELVTLAMTLLTAGYHTVRGALANSLVGLLHDRKQWELLVDRPALLPAAVEEMLRFAPGPVSGGTIRIALEDLEIEGTIIRAGEAVIPSTVSANHDGIVFTAPERIDLARDPNPHIAFGRGIHHCVGAPLARVELQAAYGGLLARFPRLRLAEPVAGLPWNAGTMIRSFSTVPVLW